MSVPPMWQGSMSARIGDVSGLGVRCQTLKRWQGGSYWWWLADGYGRREDAWGDDGLRWRESACGAVVSDHGQSCKPQVATWPVPIRS